MTCETIITVTGYHMHICTQVLKLCATGFLRVCLLCNFQKSIKKLIYSLYLICVIFSIILCFLMYFCELCTNIPTFYKLSTISVKYFFNSFKQKISKRFDFIIQNLFDILFTNYLIFSITKLLSNLHALLSRPTTEYILSCYSHICSDSHIISLVLCKSCYSFAYT